MKYVDEEDAEEGATLDFERISKSLSQTDERMVAAMIIPRPYPDRPVEVLWVGHRTADALTLEEFDIGSSDGFLDTTVAAGEQYFAYVDDRTLHVVPWEGGEPKKTDSFGSEFAWLGSEHLVTFVDRRLQTICAEDMSIVHPLYHGNMINVKEQEAENQFDSYSIESSGSIVFIIHSVAFNNQIRRLPTYYLLDVHKESKEFVNVRHKTFGTLMSLAPDRYQDETYAEGFSPFDRSEYTNISYKDMCDSYVAFQVSTNDPTKLKKNPELGDPTLLIRRIDPSTPGMWSSHSTFHFPSSAGVDNYAMAVSCRPTTTAVLNMKGDLSIFAIGKSTIDWTHDFTLLHPLQNEHEIPPIHLYADETRLRVWHETRTFQDSDRPSEGVAYDVIWF